MVSLIMEIEKVGERGKWGYPLAPRRKRFIA
jgi:hypothetical protein